MENKILYIKFNSPVTYAECFYNSYEWKWVINSGFIVLESNNNNNKTTRVVPLYNVLYYEETVQEGDK